jgi:TRAP transporter 4TM/12TM fusion protein
LKSKFNYVIAPIAVVYTGFHIYTAFFGVLPSYLQRSVHLLFGAVLAFLIVKPSQEKRHIFWSVLNIFCSVVAFLVFGYFVWQNEIASEWVPFIKPFGNLQFIICVAATLLLLEATRRLVGLPLSICVLLFVSYGRYGSYFPGLLRHQGFTWKDLMEFLYFGFNGVYGMPIAASSTLIALFIIFGCFFEKTGGGAAIMTFGKYVIGHVRGGPAKIAVITSALFGTISGSAVANVYGTGTFTIPMMKKLGYDPTFAGAVEATGSTGGQIIPPVMGAAAFVMAEITGTPYSKIMVMALLPALLYYFSIFLMVDFEAARIGPRGFPRK